MEQSHRPEAAQACAARALEALDGVLAERPPAIQAAALEVTQCLVRLRDALIDERRAGGAVSPVLAHTNALISHFFGIQYPLQGIQRDKLGQARDALAKLIVETPGR